MFRLPSNLLVINKGDRIYAKNLSSLIDGLIILKEKESKVYSLFIDSKRSVSIWIILKLIFLDLLLLPWKKESNYSIKNVGKNLENFSFWIHTTNACNLACKYCYIKKTNENLSNEVIERLPLMLKDLKEKGYQRVKYKFAGGEPLLNFPVIVKVYKAIENEAQILDLDTTYTIISNGTYITDDIQMFLKRNKKIQLAVSLDGIENFHDENRVFKNGNGSFRIIKQNIDKLIDNGIKPYLSVTVTSKSIDGIEKLYKFISKRDLQFSLNIVRENTCTSSLQNADKEVRREDSFIEKYIKAINAYKPYLSKDISVLNIFSDRARLSDMHVKPCGVEENYCVIDQKGDIHKCQMLISNKTSTGNIFSQDWIDLVRNPSDKVNVPVSEKTECSKCKYKYLCAGGCPLITKFHTGSSKNRNPNCDLYKAIFPKIFKLEAERLHKFYK
jgi:uncharacterized protein